MPDFHYQEPLPVGKDETRYRLLTSDHVSVVPFEGKDVLKVAPEALTTLEKEQRERIFKLRFQHSMGQLERSASKRTSKRDLARTLTIAAEKRSAVKA